MSKLIIVVGMLVQLSAFAGYGTSYRAVADCGYAQDWPRENYTTPHHRNCNVTLTLSPDGRDAYGDIVGDVQWIVSDMMFSGTYIQRGGKLYFDFHGKKYSAYRGGTAQGNVVSIRLGGRTVHLRH